MEKNWNKERLKMYLEMQVENHSNEVDLQSKFIKATEHDQVTLLMNDTRHRLIEEHKGMISQLEHALKLLEEV